MSGRPKIFGHLMAEIIRKDLCVACGTCAAVCPVKVISLDEGKPKLVGQCIACGMCYANCPRASFNTEEMEKALFGRIRSEDEMLLGVHQEIYAVKTTDPGILEHCQDGGAVSAILTQFLDDGGDAVIVAGLEEAAIWKAKPVVASMKKQIIENAGTKYTPSPTLVGVETAYNEYDRRNIAVVGTPCQMRGLSLVGAGDFANSKLEDAVNLRVGLFCMETFNHDSFLEYLVKEGLEPSKIEKFEIKNGRFYAYSSGEVALKVKLPKVKSLVRSCCHGCDDFASEFADISIGNVGTPAGWSTVIVRTERGKKALMSTEQGGLIEVKPVEDGKKGLDIVYRLAQMKKDNAKKNNES